MGVNKIRKVIKSGSQLPVCPIDHSLSINSAGSLLLVLPLEEDEDEDGQGHWLLGQDGGGYVHNFFSEIWLDMLGNFLMTVTLVTLVHLGLIGPGIQKDIFLVADLPTVFL